MPLVTEVTLLQDIKPKIIEIDDRIGEVQLNPTALTIQDRLKTLNTSVLAISPSAGNFTVLNSTNVNASKINLDNMNAFLGVISTNDIDINTNTTSIALKMGEVQVTPTANTQLGRLKDINTSLTSLLRSITAQGYGVITLNTNPKKIVNSNLLRKNIVIQASYTNISPCYLAYDNAVTNLSYAIILNAGDVYNNDSYLGEFHISNVTATDSVSFGEV
jgi:hypothetical protein